MAQLISITEAKQKLLELARRNDNLGESFIILRDGRPVSALLPFDEYESLLETLDILETEPDIADKLRATQKAMAKGDYTVWRPQKPSTLSDSKRGAPATKSTAASRRASPSRKRSR